jgi:hypothetical protein
MINNKLTNIEKDLFFDIYKTSLAAMLSSKKVDELDCYNINGAIDIAATIAMKSVELLINDNGLDIKNMKDIVNELKNKRPSEPIDYPVIE